MSCGVWANLRRPHGQGVSNNHILATTSAQNSPGNVGRVRCVRRLPKGLGMCQCDGLAMCALRGRMWRVSGSVVVLCCVVLCCCCAVCAALCCVEKAIRRGAGLCRCGRVWCIYVGCGRESVCDAAFKERCRMIDLSGQIKKRREFKSDDGGGGGCR